MARKALLVTQPDLGTRITDLLARGVTVADACEAVGINEATYYGWAARGRTETEARQQEDERGSKLALKTQARREKEQPFLEFFQAVTRAQADARIRAVETIRSALEPYEEESTSVEQFSETRLGKDGKPYTYERKRVRKTKTTRPGDWRAALEYLRRRDPENWTEQTTVAGTGPGGAIPISFIAVPPPKRQEGRS